MPPKKTPQGEPRTPGRRTGRSLGLPEDAAPRTPANAKDSPWFSTKNEARKRPIVGLTLAPETVEGLDALAAIMGKSRGAVVDELVARAVAAAKEAAKNS